MAAATEKEGLRMAKTKEKPIKFTSEKFKEIKRKMSRDDLEEYINGIYFRGYAKGQQASGSFDLNLALESIGQIKGIGDVKLEQIRLALIAAGAK